MMFLIVGLGNPTDKYDGTRHNVGFDIIDMLADRYNIRVEEREKKAFIGKGMIGGHKVCLVKPQTYMNLSGESVRALTDFYKLDETEEILIIYDDISLDVGQMRIRKKGSAGGHNGIKSIISHLGGQEFLRIKVGVGQKPKEYDLADYVLSRFSQNEKPQLEIGYKRVADAVEEIVAGDLDKAMNIYNKKIVTEE